MGRAIEILIKIMGAGFLLQAAAVTADRWLNSAEYPPMYGLLLGVIGFGLILFAMEDKP